MANTNANRIANAAKQACLELGLEPTFKSSRRVIESGKTSIRSFKNYHNRREITNIAEKPYTNEFGEQEAFGDICERNLEYATVFVEKNMGKFQGGVNNMTEASMYIMKKQRQELKNLKG